MVYVYSSFEIKVFNFVNTSSRPLDRPSVRVHSLFPGPDPTEGPSRGAVSGDVERGRYTVLSDRVTPPAPAPPRLEPWWTTRVDGEVCILRPTDDPVFRLRSDW